MSCFRAPLVDCHTHTRYSDGEPTILQNVQRACELGLSTIACTDHFTLPSRIDPECEVSVFWEDLPAYEADILAAREACPQIEVVYGFECDYYPGCEAYINRFRGGATYILGSVHMLDWRWIDDGSDLSYWEEMGTEAVWRRYFDVWCQACHSPVGFSSMAHPDLVRKFGLVPQDAALVSELYARAAQAAADAGVHVEINSAGARTKAGSFYPAAESLRLFCQAGVPITVGSDAHQLERVGEGVEQMYAYAYEAGYRSIDVPCAQGGWRSEEL